MPVRPIEQIADEVGMRLKMPDFMYFVASQEQLEAMCKEYWEDRTSGEHPFYNSVVAGQLLAIRDALAQKDISEAYQLLYSIADPSLSSTSPWEHMESLATAQAPSDGNTRE